MRSSLAIVLVLALPIDALAGPYASEAMGNVTFSFPSSLHLGGAFNGVVGTSEVNSFRSFNGEGFVEYHALDVMALGLVMRSQVLRELPDTLGDRANTLRVRLRVRVPLVHGSKQRRMIVPLLSLALDVGGGWLGGASENGALLAVGTQLRFELLVAGRVSPHISLGYDRTRLPDENLRQLDIGLGLTVRIAGRTAFGPRPRRTLDLPDGLDVGDEGTRLRR